MRHIPSMPSDRNTSRPGLDFIVTRHAATAQWLTEALAESGRRQVHLSHLSPALLQRPHWQGRCVHWSAVRFIGNLPPGLAADICAAGAEFWTPELSLLPYDRGRELHAADLRASPPTLARYQVVRLAPMACALSADKT